MRNNAREAALNIIFSKQFNDDCSDNFIKTVFQQFKLTKDDDVQFAVDLINSVKNNEVELKNKIEEVCHHYHENRINPMDRSILLIALSEILYFDDIPAVVSVSEATNLAKKYSSEKSADFVNGVLAGVING